MIRILLLALLFTLPAAALAARPNVIVIYTDDQGTVDAGCFGSDDLTTPHIDALASRGVRLTQMYAPSAVCSPSRAGLLTGRFPLRAGVPGNVAYRPGQPGLPSSEVTMAEVFKQAGYATGHVGKWHLGHSPETMPNGQGFDSSFGHLGGCIDNYSHYFYWNGPNRHDLWRDGEEIWRDGEFFPDLMVDECLRFIDRQNSRPFFLYWAINLPHYPLQGTDRWREHYQHLDPPRQMYAAFVSTLDEAIGRVLARVTELDLQEQTIIVFQSDHGHSTEERTFGGGGSAGPCRGAKGCLFEGGIRVPSIISWPGTLPQGEVRDQFATGCDWLLTLVDLCGLESPEVHLDGRSLAPVLRENAASPQETFYWHLGSGRQPQWAVRKGGWKLLGNPRDTSQPKSLPNGTGRFLVNLDEDPGEQQNQAEQHPEIVAELEAIRERYLESIQGTQ